MMDAPNGTELRLGNIDLSAGGKTYKVRQI